MITIVAALCSLLFLRTSSIDAAFSPVSLEDQHRSKSRQGIFAVKDKQKGSVVMLDYGKVGGLIQSLTEQDLPQLHDDLFEVIVPSMVDMLGRAMSKATQDLLLRDVGASASWWSYYDNAAGVLLSDFWLWQMVILVREAELDSSLRLDSHHDDFSANSHVNFSVGNVLVRRIRGENLEQVFLQEFWQHRRILRHGRSLENHFWNLQDHLKKYKDGSSSIGACNGPLISQ